MARLLSLLLLSAFILAATGNQLHGALKSRKLVQETEADAVPDSKLHKPAS